MLSQFFLAPFTEPSFRHSLAAVLALAFSAGPIGVFLMLRRMSLVGDAMAHAILPGVGSRFARRHEQRGAGEQSSEDPDEGGRMRRLPRPGRGASPGSSGSLTFPPLTHVSPEFTFDLELILLGSRRHQSPTAHSAAA